LVLADINKSEGSLREVRRRDGNRKTEVEGATGTRFVGPGGSALGRERRGAGRRNGRMFKYGGRDMRGVVVV
jgi:hypothetical protein